MKKISQKKLAEIAGVSITTVSRVINKSGYVSEENRRKVLTAMSETGYINSRQNTKPGRIGIISPCWVHNPYFSKLNMRIQKVCESKGYEPVFKIATIIMDDNLVTYAEQLADLDVCGIIVTDYFGEKVSDHTIDILHKLNVPFVFMERLGSDYIFDYVRIDHRFGTYCAAKSLLDKGHRHLLYVTYSGTADAEKDRISGFNRAIKEYEDTGSIGTLVYCDNLYPNTAAPAVQDALSQNPDITGIVSWSDTYAQSAVIAALSIGRSIPDDIEIIGYDDTTAEKMYPPLSSVHMPMTEMAEAAVNLIHARIADPDAAEKVITLKPKLILRGT